MLEARLGEATLGTPGAAADDPAGQAGQAGQAGLPFRFPPGRTAHVTSMKLNLDPPAPNTRTRPLFYYFITDVLVCGLLTPLLMRRRGFRHHRIRGMRYWFRPGDPATSPPQAAAAAADADADADAAAPPGDGGATAAELLGRRRGWGAAGAQLGFVNAAGLRQRWAEETQDAEQARDRGEIAARCLSPQPSPSPTTGARSRRDRGEMPPPSHV